MTLIEKAWEVEHFYLIKLYGKTLPKKEQRELADNIRELYDARKHIAMLESILDQDLPYQWRDQVVAWKDRWPDA